MSLGDVTGNITKGQVARYMLTPQIAPRLNQLYTEGFAHLAYFIAMVYRAVNILPATHAIFRPENRRLLGVRSVMAAAGAELKFTRKEIDKVFIYFAILTGLILLVAQFMLTLAYLMLNPAYAMPDTYGDFFAEPQYDTDVAYQLLSMVFGVPELFGGQRRPFHVAMHGMFQLYSIGLLVIAVIIACYMIFAIVVETAQTGVPFGKRYNHVWAPIRLVFALGLLVPMGYGLNAAQWITLYMAKYGSDFATRGWIIFNDEMAQAYLENPEERVGRPQSPTLTSLASFMMMVLACETAYERLYGGDNPIEIDAYLVRNPAQAGGGMVLMEQMDGYLAAKEWFDNGDILIRFGQHDPLRNQKYLGNVRPYCGDLVIFAGDATEPGAEAIQTFYYDMVEELWDDLYGILEAAQDFVGPNSTDVNLWDAEAVPLPADFKYTIANEMAAAVDEAVENAVEEQANSDTWLQDQADIVALGWGGAGIWYNKIAQINGSLVTAVNNVPQPKLMPEVMTFTMAKQLQQNTEMSSNPYRVNLANGKKIKYENTADETIAIMLGNLFEYWSKEDTRQDNISSQTRQTNNIFIDVINTIFGTRGLFDMCASADVHPLAQLSILGKGLVEASVRNIGLGLAVSAGGALPYAFAGIAAKTASSILLTVASITMSLGFVLYYVVPFLPFLYFFFAVGGWVKGLFEAMVGVPLWALSHLRIDGEGLPGDAGISGYFLIFEIFLRPILIVFGLLASVVIFSAMVKVLNEIFSLVVVNLAGHDENSRVLCGQMGGGAGGGAGVGGDAVAFFRGPIDELFFTVVYAIIVYMIGMSCFKLIDLVPNNLMRYMNANVSTFNDQQNSPAEGMVTTLGYGGSRVANSVIGIGKDAGGAAGNALKAGFETMGNGGKQ